MSDSRLHRLQRKVGAANTLLIAFQHPTGRPPGKILGPLLKEGGAAEDGLYHGRQELAAAEAFLGHCRETCKWLLKRLIAVALCLYAAVLAFDFVPRLFAPADTLFVQRTLVAMVVVAYVWRVLMVRSRAACSSRPPRPGGQDHA